MATETKDLEQAYEQLKELLNNNELMELYYAREKALHDWNDSMHYAKKEGENRMSMLYQLLVRDKRDADIPKAFTDPSFREKLFIEYGI